MSMAETMLFSKSRWFVMWYWKILNRIIGYKLQDLVLGILICTSDSSTNPRVNSSMYTMLPVKELRPFNFLPFWSKARLTFSFLLVLAWRTERGSFTAWLLMVFYFVFIKNVETWTLCQNYFIIEGWVGWMNELAAVQKSISSTDNGESDSATTVQAMLNCNKFCRTGDWCAQLMNRYRCKG